MAALSTLHAKAVHQEAGPLDIVVVAVADLLAYGPVAATADAPALFGLLGSAEALSRLGVAAQVEFESMVWKQFIML